MAKVVGILDVLIQFNFVLRQERLRMGLYNASHNSSRPSREELPPGFFVPVRQSTQSLGKERGKAVGQGVSQFNCRVTCFSASRTLGPGVESLEEGWE